MAVPYPTESPCFLGPYKPRAYNPSETNCVRFVSRLVSHHFLNLLLQYSISSSLATLKFHSIK